MTAAIIQRLFEHLRWADDRVARSLEDAPDASEEAWDLYAHVLGAEQVWLARVLDTPPGPVWPDPDPAALAVLRAAVQEGYAALVDGLTEPELAELISYTNSAGDDFTSTLEDILHHVFLHGAYHRGQVALLLRKAGAEPSPTDYIAFVRGSPAATRADASRRESP